jgi:hypothetical protein
MNVFEKTGCREDSDYKGIYYHKNLPFELSDNNGFLMLQVTLEYVVSNNKIPTTEESIKKLIDTFNPNGR